VDEFLIMEQIGAGGFSRVHIAQHIPTGYYSAVKIVDLSKLSEDEVKSMVREISVFMLVSHPNLIRCYRTSTAGSNLFFFMEFAPGGTLLDLVKEKKGMNEGLAQHYFKQLFSAVRHLHLHHFLAHRDLKLGNVLLTEKGVVKLADFGLAGTSFNCLMHTFVGTPGFQAPEVVAGFEYSEKCDVWSLAVCLYSMVAGKLPFSTQNANYRTFLNEVAELQYPNTFSRMLADLLQKMLVIKPDDRPSLIQIQGHPWLKGLEQISANIAPEPIVFHVARSMAALSKFKRKKTVANPEIVSRCAEFGIAAEQLTAELTNGDITAATTTYFVLCWPVNRRPEPKARAHAARSARSDDSAASKGEKLPPLKPSAQAASHGPLHAPPQPRFGATIGPRVPLMMQVRRTIDMSGTLKKRKT
jgi:serine/threonine protein kinase